MSPSKKITSEQRRKKNIESVKKTLSKLAEDGKNNEGNYIKQHDTPENYIRALRAFPGDSEENKEKRNKIKLLNDDHRTNLKRVNKESYKRRKITRSGPSSVVVPPVTPSASREQAENARKKRIMKRQIGVM